MTTLTYAERLERLDTFVREGRITRWVWTGTDEQGRETVSFLSALSPEAQAVEGSYACPADVMPSSLAHVTPSVLDRISDAAWRPVIERYRRAAHRWPALSTDAWRRVQAKTMLAALAIAEPQDASDSCEDVSALWARELAGDPPSAGKWTWAENAASDAAEQVEKWSLKKERAAWTAAQAAWAGSARPDPAGISAVARAARLAAEAATETVSDRAAAWDQIASALLDAIEAECDRAEAAE